MILAYLHHPSFDRILSTQFRMIFSSVQFNCSVVSNSLQPHEPQQVRPPCLPPTPRVHPNPCPLSQWCHPTISSIIYFSSFPQSFPASGSSQMSEFFTSGGQSLEFQLQHQFHQWTPRTDLLYDGLVGCPEVQGTLKSLLQHHSSKASFFGAQISL